MEEYLLETLLTDMYGNNHDVWEKQYTLPSRITVDAYIKTNGNKEKIVIEFKFSFDKYNKFLNTSEKTNKDKYLLVFKKYLENWLNWVARYINEENKKWKNNEFVKIKNIWKINP